MENKTKLDNKNILSFWTLLKGTKPSKWLIALALLLSLLETITGLVVPLLTKTLVDQLAGSTIEISIILLLVTVFLLQTVSSGFSFYVMSYIGEKIVSSIRTSLWNQVLHLPIPYFDKHQSGEIMSRVTQDTNTVKTLVTQHLISFISGIISIIGAVIILFLIDWQMTLIMLIAVPLAILIVMPLGQKMYRVSLATQDEMANLSGHLGRVLADIRLVKAYHAENKEQKNGYKGIQGLFRYGLKEARILAVISPIMTFIVMFVLVILIGYGGVRVASGVLTAGTLVAIIIYMFQIVVPFSQMAAFFAAFQKAMGATERIQSILSMERESFDGQLPINNSNQDICFHNVSFSYKEDEPILKNIDLRIPAGQTTAIVGPSGSGKTTIFSLLERFYLATEGTIHLGKINIEEYDLLSWREKIGYVSQESPVMSGTIKENICYGIDRDVSVEEIERAAAQANATEFIEKLPKGFDTEIGERGITLSGGQRQRIAIARALIRDPQILLLDEATSHLDSASESLVQGALDRLMKGRTTIVIAHRLSTIMDAEQIVVLENGKLTGKGTHEKLYETHSLYQQLTNQQTRAEASTGN